MFTIIKIHELGYRILLCLRQANSQNVPISGQLFVLNLDNNILPSEPDIVDIINPLVQPREHNSNEIEIDIFVPFITTAFKYLLKIRRFVSVQFKGTTF